MTIEIRDKRNIHNVPLGDLLPGDTFMFHEELFIIVNSGDLPVKDNVYPCLELNKVHPGKVTYLYRTALVQQVTLSVEVHLV